MNRHVVISIALVLLAACGVLPAPTDLDTPAAEMSARPGLTRTAIPLYPPHTPGATYAVIRQWADVLHSTPFPYATPLPASLGTPIDGVYAKHDPGEPQWWNCRRCAEYYPAGGNWRMWLDKGILRFYYEVTGFSTVLSYSVAGNRLHLFNDPICPYEAGEYTWRLESRSLELREVQDECAIHLRAENLTRQPWLSCQPPNTEAAVSDHWLPPEGCR